jgi:hypothetical protein
MKSFEGLLMNRSQEIIRPWPKLMDSAYLLNKFWCGFRCMVDFDCFEASVTKSPRRVLRLPTEMLSASLNCRGFELCAAR